MMQRVDALAAELKRRWGMVKGNFMKGKGKGKKKGPNGELLFCRMQDLPQQAFATRTEALDALDRRDRSARPL